MATKLSKYSLIFCVLALLSGCGVTTLKEHLVPRVFENVYNLKGQLLYKDDVNITVKSSNGRTTSNFLWVATRRNHKFLNPNKVKGSFWLSIILTHYEDGRPRGSSRRVVPVLLHTRFAHLPPKVEQEITTNMGATNRGVVTAKWKLLMSDFPPSVDSENSESVVVVMEGTEVQPYRL